MDTTITLLRYILIAYGAIGLCVLAVTWLLFRRRDATYDNAPEAPVDVRSMTPSQAFVPVSSAWNKVSTYEISRPQALDEGVMPAAASSTRRLRVRRRVFGGRSRSCT